MRGALRACALFLAVVAAAAGDVNVTDVDVSQDVTSKAGVTKDFTTETVIKGTAVAFTPSENSSDSTSDVAFRNAASSVASNSDAVSDAPTSVSSKTAVEAERSNETTSTANMQLNATSPAFHADLPTEGTVDDLAYSASNGSWSSADDAPSVTLTSCEMTTERRLSVIQSPGFPSPYAQDVECRYAVKRYSLDVCSVTFLFNVFDLEPSESCAKDYVDLHGERLCGAKTTGLTRSVPFRSAVDDQVVLRFRSDSTTSGVGFMATVVQQECPPPDCDHQFTGVKFEIRSPGFPGPYENRQLCDYTVVRAGPRICRIRLQVRLFDVEAADHCEADSLEVKGDKLCGNIPAGEIVSVDFREPLLMIRFRSDHTTTRDGFHLLGTQEECPPDDLSSNLTTTDQEAR